MDKLNSFLYFSVPFIFCNKSLNNSLDCIFLKKQDFIFAWMHFEKWTNSFKHVLKANFMVFQNQLLSLLYNYFLALALSETSFGF